MKSNEEIRWFFIPWLNTPVFLSRAHPTCKLLEKAYGHTLQLIFSTARYPDAAFAVRQGRTLHRAGAVASCGQSRAFLNCGHWLSDRPSEIICRKAVNWYGPF